MRRNGLVWKSLLALVMVLFCAANVLAYDITGTVSYSGGKTGQVIVQAATNGGMRGTVVQLSSGTATYTIRGIDDFSTGYVTAFMDSLGTGTQHFTDPSGTSATPFTSSSASGISVTLTEPSSIPPLTAPGQPIVFAGPGMIMAMWSPPSSIASGEFADSYNVYVGVNTRVNPGPGNYDFVQTGVKAIGDKGAFFLNGIPDGPVYVSVSAVVNGSEGPVSNASSVVNVVPPGTATVTGSVDLQSISATSVPLYVALCIDSQNGPPTSCKLAASQLVNAPSTASFSVSDVPNGTYSAYAILDRNNNGLIDPGDLSNTDMGAPVVTVSGSAVSGVSVALSNANAHVHVMTNHWKDSVNESYGISFNIRGNAKNPVAFTSTGGAGLVAGNVDFATDGRNDLYGWRGAAMTVPTGTYPLTVMYSDNTTENFNAAVTGVLTDFATPIAPLGNRTFLTDNGIPTFSWNPPANPPATYTYQLEVRSSDGSIAWYPQNIPSSTTSVLYNFDNSATAASLADNQSYTFTVTVIDTTLGNSSSNQVAFSYGTPVTNGSISGYVRDSSSNAGIANDLVNLYNGTTNTLITSMYSDPSGYYYFNNLAPGTYKIQFNPVLGYPGMWYNGSVTLASATPVSVIGGQNSTVNGFLSSTGGPASDLSFVTTSLSSATTSFPYSQQLQATGGTPPYTFTIATGSLPPGVGFSPSAGTITGTPTASGSYTFSMNVKDATNTTVTSSPLTITVTAPSLPYLQYGGVYHVTKADGTQWDFLDLGTTSTATTLGTMTATVTGPNGFTYAFTDADINPYLNNQLTFSKQLDATSPLYPLASGVYTFTYTDGSGNINKRVDTYANPVVMPIVDSTTIQFQRKSDGSYRFSWAPVNAAATYYYRLRIEKNDGSRIPVYLGSRMLTTFNDVPAGTLVDGTAYSVRVEVYDASSFDMSFNRSQSAFVPFTPQASDSPNMILYNYVGAHNLFDATGSLGAGFGFGVCNSAGTSCTATEANLVTAAEIFAPDGSLYYTFNLVTDKQSNGVDFYHIFPTTPVTGTYKFHFVANGVDHYAYATLSSPVSNSTPDTTAYQVVEQSNGTLRFSWANVGQNGYTYYRVQLKDTVTGAFYTSSRLNQTFTDISRTTLVNYFGSLANVQWRVEVYDSGNYNTVRNRVNGPWSPTTLASTPAYSSALPVIGNYGIANVVYSNTAATELWFAANSSVSTITELRVEGPNGYLKDLKVVGFSDRNGQYRFIDTAPMSSGLYKFTAIDALGNSSIVYDYLPTPHAIPIVDIRSVQINEEQTGDIRFSWAPGYSDVQTFCSLFIYENTDVNGTGAPDILTSTNASQSSSVVVSASYLTQPGTMFRFHCSDSSTTSTQNNRSRSIMAGYAGPGFDYSTLVDTDGDGYASNTDANDNNALIYPFSSVAADTTAPSVPTGLQLNPISANQMNVSWNSSTDNVAVTYYKVFRDGILVSQPSGANNTFWSDTTVAAMTTYSYTVAACDAANNCSAQSSANSAATPSGGNIVPVTFTGTVSYSGSKTGYVYVNVQTNNGTLGTAIKWTAGMTSANYTIRGVPPTNVSNTITAYLDSLDNGIQTASSPVGTSFGSTASGRNITLAQPSLSAPAAPQYVEVKPGNSSVMMMWQPNRVNSVIDADYYDIYWNTTAQVSSTNFVGQKLGVAAGLDSPIVISSLTNGTGYYFQIVPRVGGLTGTASVTGPVTVGAATGLNTVSGSVTYNGTISANTPLLVAVVGTGSDKGLGTVYFTQVDNAVSGQAFTVTGVPDGSYEVYAILDLNKDGIIGTGDVTNTSSDAAPIVSLSGGTGAAMGAIALLSRNAEVAITTDHFKSGASEWYNISGSIAGQLKRPVSATLMTAPANSTLFYVPMDITIGNNNGKDMQFWGGGTQAPVVGESYSFTINYSDDTQDLGVTAQVTGVISNFPLNPTISNPVSTVPTFSWAAPAVAPVGNYMYSLWVGSNNGNNMWEQWSIPSTILSVTYGSGSTSPSPLQVGAQYNWNVSVRDQKGNRASVGSTFIPTISGAAADTTAPAIVATVPLNNATGVSTTAPISITFTEAVTGLPDLAAALKDNSTGLFVPGTGISSADGKTHTFIPGVVLSSGITYSIQFSTVTDLVGNQLPATTLTFTTATSDTTKPVTTAAPAGGLYNTNQVVTLTANESATIYYTTNGATPTTASAVYSAPITISATTTLKYFAKDTAGNIEAVSSQVYTIDKTAPVTAPSVAAGTYGASFTVTLTASETATIYYTTDGSEPTTSSSVYSATPISVSAASTTLKFFAVDSAGNSEAVKTVIYVIDTSLPVTTVSPAGGLYNSAQSVTLTANKAGSSIYFTLDGSTPTVSSPKYSAAILVSASSTLKFFAKDSTGNSEAVRTETYTIDTVKPSVSATTPAVGATAVAYDSVITVTFSEAVKESTVNSASIQVSTSSASIAGTLSYSPGTLTATFTPTVLLPSGTVIYLSVANVEDLAGNKVVALNRSFTTAFPDGDYNGDGIFNIADVNEILKASLQRTTPTAAQLKRIDIGPLAGGRPSPDGVVDVSDVVVALRKLVGLVSW